MNDGKSRSRILQDLVIFGFSDSVEDSCDHKGQHRQRTHTSLYYRALISQWRLTGADILFPKSR